MDHSKNEKKRAVPIAPEIKPHVDALLGWIVADEKEGYDNKLVPFTQREAKIRAQGEEEIIQLQTKLQNAVRILKEQFELQERQKSDVPEGASFALFEAAFTALREQVKEPSFDIVELFFSTPIQERMGLAWSFMDRAYSVGKALLDAKNYEEAEAVFTFLRILHPDVYEYWFGQAIAQQACMKLEEAIDSYTKSLRLQPENPMPFFQLASCYLALNDVASSIKALEFCIDLAKADPNQAKLVQDAEEIKQALKLKKVA